MGKPRDKVNALVMEDPSYKANNQWLTLLLILEPYDNPNRVNDPDLNRNTTKYRDNHIHKDAMEIILQFINVKY